MADLAGKRVMAVGEGAFGGSQLAWREFAQLGMDPFTDFSTLDFVGLPMSKLTEAVSEGRTDSGIVRACTIERLSPQAQSKFRVLSPRFEPDFPCQTSTRLYPDWPIATLRSTPPALADHSKRSGRDRSPHGQRGPVFNPSCHRALRRLGGCPSGPPCSQLGHDVILMTNLT